MPKLNSLVIRCQLDEVTGLNLGNTYRNRFAATIFIEAIADVYKDYIKTPHKYAIAL
jgi:hypothetical protein